MLRNGYGETEKGAHSMSSPRLRLSAEKSPSITQELWRGPMRQDGCPEPTLSWSTGGQASRAGFSGSGVSRMGTGGEYVGKPSSGSGGWHWVLLWDQMPEKGQESCPRDSD